MRRRRRCRRSSATRSRARSSRWARASPRRRSAIASWPARASAATSTPSTSPRATRSRCREGLSFEQGAAIPVNYATAWAALLGYGSLRPGERVLIHAAAGGVGISALQLAKAAGAEVHGTASPGKHARLAELGLDRAIDYRRDGWWKGLPSYDLILDAVGGRSFQRSYGLLRAGGRLVAYGASSINVGEKRNLARVLPQAGRMFRGFNLIKQMSESKSVIGLNMLALWDDRGTLEPWIIPGDRGAGRRHRQPRRACRGAVRRRARGPSDHRGA